MTDTNKIFKEYCDYLANAQKKYGPQTSLLYQFGMFYEVYGVENEREKIGNTREIAEILNIQLTRKDKKNPENNRKNYLMAGFPVSHINRYVKILLDNNYTVVIVNQLTEPPNVTRGIDRVYSPGTSIDDAHCHAENNFLMTIYFQGEPIRNKKDKLISVGLATVDLSTGESYVYGTGSTIDDPDFAMDETFRFIRAHNPREIVIYIEDLGLSLHKKDIVELLELQEYVIHIHESVPKDYCKVSYQNGFFGKIFKDHGILSPIEWLDLENQQLGALAYLLVLQFAWEHNEKIVEKLKKPEIWVPDKHLILANNAIEQLTLTTSGTSVTGLGKNSKYRSVFHLIDHTSTSMGKRLLKHRLLAPIRDIETLNQRYDLIGEMLKKITGDGISANADVAGADADDASVDTDMYQYQVFEKNLSKIMDIQRFHRKILIKSLQPTEFNALHNSYQWIRKIIDLIYSGISTSPSFTKLLTDNAEIFKRFQEYQTHYMSILNLEETHKYNFGTITDSFFKVGYNQELDEISYKIRHYEQYFKILTRALSNLIIQGDDCVTLKYSEDIGHYVNLTQNRYKILLENWKKHPQYQSGGLEIRVDAKVYKVDLSDLEMSPVSKKSTSCNLFSIKAFKEISDELVELQSEAKSKTTSVYLDFLENLGKTWGDVCEGITDLIAEIDVAKSGAKTSIMYCYNRPEIRSNEKSFIQATEMRHPIIERINQQIAYVPHDIGLGAEMKCGEENFNVDGMLVYGVNSCGKSSLMKSVGINLVLAQAGMYVASKTFKYYPYKYLLTRILGNDNIFKSQSSFAVEMSELRGIIERADAFSLVLGDEICKGTETISAVSIVGGSIMSLSKAKSSFIFATHLHQLTDIPEINSLENVKNFHLQISVNEKKELIYDRHLRPGSGDPIYGLEVATAMGLDKELLENANKIRRKLMGVSDMVLCLQKSHFNSEVYMDLCEICGAKATQVHHIKYQCTADENNFVGHYHKNNKANLVPICQSCHSKVHWEYSHASEQLVIDGYKDTTEGRKLVFYNKKN